MSYQILILVGIVLAVGFGYLLILIYSDRQDRPVLPSHYNVERYAKGGVGDDGTQPKSWGYCTACETRNDADLQHCRICGAELRSSDDLDPSDVFDVTNAGGRSR